MPREFEGLSGMKKNDTEVNEITLIRRTLRSSSDIRKLSIILVSSVLLVIYLYKYCGPHCLSLSRSSKCTSLNGEPGRAVKGINRKDHKVHLLLVII